MSGPAAASGQASQSASPEARSSEDKVIGWCTFRGCSEGFTSWEDHVQHHMSSHISQSVQRHFCRKCLMRPSRPEAHTAAHSNLRLGCSECSATFVSPGHLSAHRIQFHHHSPTENLRGRTVAATAAGTSRPSSASSAAAGTRPSSASSAAAGTRPSSASSAAAGTRPSSASSAAAGTRPSSASSATPGTSRPSSASSAAAGTSRPSSASSAAAGTSRPSSASSAAAGMSRHSSASSAAAGTSRPSSASSAAAGTSRPSSVSSAAGPHCDFVEDAAPDMIWCMIPQCSAGFSSWERYADHYNSTHQSASGSPDSRPVIGWCTYPHCGRPFCSWEEHVLHQRMCHANRAQVDAMCSLCLQMEPVGGLPGHLQLHRKGDVACPLCSARFVDGDVSSHMTQFHHVRPDGSVPAVLGWCTKSGCGSSFCSWEDYVQHNIHQHSMVSDPALVCHLCLRQHGNLAEAKEHIKEHSNASTEPFKCEMCPARFFNFRHRSSHMRRFHRHNC